MKIKFFIISFAALCLSVSPAFADLYGTVDATYQSLTRGYSQIELSFAGGPLHTEQSIGLHLLNLGALDISSATHTLPSNSYLQQGIVEAFCIDLSQGFPFQATTYDAVSLDVPPNPLGPMGTDKALYIAQLLNTQTYLTPDDAAALQVAMWEIIYETDATWNTTSGTGFYLGSGANETYIGGLANTMLSGLAKANSYSQYTGLSQYGKNIQDFVVVPVPAALVLGVIGLGVAGLKLRKFA
jgi:hypothetical protein